MSQVSRQQDVTIIELGPSYESLDQPVLGEISRVLLSEASRADPPRVVLDLSGTNYIGSAFVELLVRVWKRLTQRGGTMVLCGLRPFCVEVLRATRLDRLWKAFPTRDQAVAAMRESPGHQAPS
ncbi:MAG: STAS domain-containing protein [Planctomycetota bacterium]|jgi:anti-anti-sigma factor